MLIRAAEVEGRPGTDVRIERGVITATGRQLRARRGEDVLDAAGGALLPGLHDHHVHLRALAAADTSVPVGPADVRDAAGFAARLAAVGRSDGWVRAVGYHESVAGDLDRWRLDALGPDRPVRVQHRSGALWVLNSRALAALDTDGAAELEHDERGRPTGRLWRRDRWLSSRLPRSENSLAEVSARAAAAGVVGFTDATPEASQADLADLAERVDSGELRQRVHCMAPPGRQAPECARFTLGPTKTLLDDTTLPPVDELAERFRAAHAAGRPVAVHCVTYVQLVATLAALADAGPLAGDRIEHGALVPAELFGRLRALAVTVVTQPGFVAERGDAYLAEVDERDRPDLWRLRSLLDAGVPVAGSTDAPFGHHDPWAAITAASRRRTSGGAELGPGERLDPRRALDLFLGPATAPGRRRQVTPGTAADLCLLAVPLAEALDTLDATAVRATLVAGEIIHLRT